MDAITNVRTILTPDADTTLTFAEPVYNISFAIITQSITNPVYIKPRAALTGANAAAWASDATAYKLTSGVPAVDMHFSGGVSSIHIGSASAEEIQWHSSLR